ncbi:TetR/AcrR family transcriptional regulator [Streptomyces sp. NPDC006645]|uniref:TetR/AcrR family transcriptional regulator n=1 Tax=unclassified Streptomyces TaxID=2593676 RepID=UPI0033AEABE9
MPEARRGGAVGQGIQGGAAEGGTAKSGAAKSGASADDTGRPRRRQARGERRIAQLLEAAGRVFCTTGYTAASTNSIAREAGVSPGTLYQFFPNKEAIAVELGDVLLNRWRTTYGQAFTPAHMELPLPEMLDAVLDPLITFNFENPAFAVLMHGSEIPGQVTEKHDVLHDTMLTRVEEILGSYLPDTPRAERTRTAEFVFVLFKGGLDLILSHEGEEREAYIGELKNAMFRYLEPLVGDALPLCRPQQEAAPTDS